MTKTAVVIALVVGLLGNFLGPAIAMPGLGTLLAVVILGGFILSELEDKNS